MAVSPGLTFLFATTYYIASSQAVPYSRHMDDGTTLAPLVFRVAGSSTIKRTHASTSQHVSADRVSMWPGFDVHAMIMVTRYERTFGSVAALKLTSVGGTIAS